MVVVIVVVVVSVIVVIVVVVVEVSAAQQYYVYTGKSSCTHSHVSTSHTIHSKVTVAGN